MTTIYEDGNPYAAYSPKFGRSTDPSSGTLPLSAAKDRSETTSNAPWYSRLTKSITSLFDRFNGPQPSTHVTSHGTRTSDELSRLYPKSSAFEWTMGLTAAGGIFAVTLPTVVPIMRNTISATAMACTAAMSQFNHSKVS